LLQWPAYVFLEETISLGEIVTSDNRLISRSHNLLDQSREMLARPCPDVFLGRRNLIEPPPIEYE
jgi:hypothetical protein